MSALTTMRRQFARSDDRPAPRSLQAIATALLTSVLLLGLGSTAAATPTITFGANFDPFAYYGEGSVVDAGLTFSGSEYEGRVAPLTSLKLHLPAGTGASFAGFPTCSTETLHNSGLGGCPEGSLAGPITSYIASFTALVPFGEEAVPENGDVEALFGPEEKLYLYFFGYYPVLVEFVAEGHLEAGGSGEGPVLSFSLPTYDTVPGKAVSLTSLELELGATREEANGTEVSSITVPPASDCPHGSFAWSVEADFNNEPSSVVSASEEGDCMQSGNHLRDKSTMRLEVLPTASPHEEQPVTFTAWLHPEGGAEMAGSVTFYEGVVPIEGCQLIAVTKGVPTASCEVSYIEPFTHTIHAVYSGDENYRGSYSSPTTITVQEGPAPPEEHHEAPKELAHEPPKPSGGGTTGDSTSGGSTTGGGSTTTATVSSAAVAAALKHDLVVSGEAPSIGSLLKHGGLNETVSAPEAGTLSVSWYSVPKGAEDAKAQKPVLVAAGRVVFGAAGVGILKLRLTATGRRLLRKAHTFAVRVEGRFTASGGMVMRSIDSVTVRHS